jgi:cation transporter-like permease
MREIRSPVKLAIIACVLDVFGNIGLWAGAVAYRFLHAEEARVDDSRITQVMVTCQYVGYFLLLLNIIAVLVALHRGIRSRKWGWVVLSIVLLAALAYGSLLIWVFYGMALMTP